MTSTAEGNEALFCFAEDRFLSLFWRKSDFWFNEVPFALHPPASVKKILFCFFFNLFPKEVCLITVQALDNKSLSNAQRHTFKILIPRHQSYHELHSGREWSEKEKPSERPPSRSVLGFVPKRSKQQLFLQHLMNRSYLNRIISIFTLFSFSLPWCNISFNLK